MYDIINFLKGAVNRTAAGTVMGCYIVRQGSISTRNESMQAGVCMETEIEFNVPAEEFETALDRMKQVTALEVSGEELILKGGRLKAAIQCVHEEPPEVPELPQEWRPSPEGLSSALKLAIPFLNDQSWSAGMRLMTGRITAIKNTCGIDITLSGLKMDPLLITRECAEFIAGQGDPSEYAIQGNAIIFQWGDGRWLRLQRMHGDFPPMVDDIFTKAGTVTPVPITKDFREAYEDAAALSDGTVILTQRGLQVFKGVRRVDIEVEIPELPKDHKSRWQTKILGPVIEKAEAWNPAASPEPSAFIGPSFRGVVVGIQI